MVIRIDMRAKEFDEATIEQLQAEADRYLEEAEAPYEAGKRYADDAERLRLLFKAQFYLSAVARKRDDETSRRDFKLEKIVIALISLEIVLSLIFGLIGLAEGYQQADILDKMRKSADATAQAMEAARTSLQHLSDDQSASRSSLEQMNRSLQQSLTTTNGMAGAMIKQLGILQEDQKNKALQLSRKPKLVLYIGAVPADATLKVSFTPRETTDTSLSFDCAFTNEGTASATKPMLRAIIFNKNVTLSSSNGVQSPPQPIDATNRVFLINFPDMRPHIRIPVVLTFTFPKGEKPFEVVFNADADEIETGTPMGAMSITPRKPLD
jgi:hypothetical protein